MTVTWLPHYETYSFLHYIVEIKLSFAVVDPGFPYGTHRRGGATNLVLWRIFPKDCMKMNKIGPIGGSANVSCCFCFKEIDPLPKKTDYCYLSCPFAFFPWYKQGDHQIGGNLPGMSANLAWLTPGLIKWDALLGNLVFLVDDNDQFSALTTR